MRLLLILVVAAAAIAVAADSASVTLAFSGHGASAYDKWLYQNAKEYPGLSPIYVQIDSEAKGAHRTYSYWVSFLDDSGAVVLKRTFTGVREPRPVNGHVKSYYVYTPGSGDALFVSPEVGLTIAYNRSGDSVFTSTAGDIQGDGGLYLRQFLDEEGCVCKDAIEVLDTRGAVASTIRGPVGPSVYAHVWSCDKVHALCISDTVGQIMVMDKGGKTLWQGGLGSATAADVAISDDGRFVAAATWDSLIIRDIQAGKTVGRPLRKGGLGKFLGPRVAISPDDRYVAVARFHALAHDSVLLDVFTPDGAVACTTLALRTGMVMGVGFVEGNVWMVARALEYTEAGVLHMPRRTQSSDEPYRVVMVGLDGQTRTWDGVGPSHPHPPMKVAGNALVFYGRDSISVYRIEAGTTEERK